MVYKVCEFRGGPRIKISEEPGKTTIAGAKSALRAMTSAGEPMFDILCLRDEFKQILAEPSLIEKVYDRLTKQVAVENPFVRTEQSQFGGLEQISIDIYVEGRVIEEQDSLQERQAFVKYQLAKFGGYERLIAENRPYQVYLTPRLYQLQEQL
mmetsp:Transcript_9277/g.11325  ORF Transcript_9277/g.11325 Transcript_9277/m.11325 type:complete len:153 (-) Transcript_9277:107-565(-)